jgi:hypothetical protein
MSMSISIDTGFGSRKAELLAYLRSRTKELLADVTRTYGTTQFRKRASAINKALAQERASVESVIAQTATKEQWSNAEHLRAKLLLMHCTNVLILESRNIVWPYEYMAFSRRIGELWEPFVTSCFALPVADDVSLFVPPLFDDIRSRLSQEVRDFIAQLTIDEQSKQTLLAYYDQVWQLVTSGEIKLELDLHFTHGGVRHVVDCKSGFGSNEKGNTNRLLLVASIYRNIEPEEYRCMLFVRSQEDENNNYLQTLKNSGLWEVYCGAETYPQVSEFSGFDLGQWITDNVRWSEDLDEEFYEYLKANDLSKYLSW